MAEQPMPSLQDIHDRLESIVILTHDHPSKWALHRIRAHALEAQRLTAELGITANASLERIQRTVARLGDIGGSHGN